MNDHTGDKQMTRLLFAVSALALAASPAFARDQIRIVGSSTVYPFTTAVAEAFGKSSGMKTPVVESTGTGGGLKLFCEGVGEDTPDIANASRPIKKSEFELCASNGVKDIVELPIGFDGLTLAQSKEGTPLKLTLKQVFLALAEKVPNEPNDRRLPRRVDRGDRSDCVHRHAGNRHITGGIP